ncbi:N-acetyltransferase ESCO1-like isoform X2 [Patiria miniata]|nr:N-acetyltransferase ESCO1-like isoform X2 [Patiria miniata]XP_038056899.1 N-acetyltransferase ESCO1-like isoform X2 [Patiria miniata]
MLGVKSPSRQRNATSPIETRTSRKRRLTASGDSGGASLDASLDASQRKRQRSSENDFEEDSPTFSAKCFYSPKGRGGYQTPLERQKRREELGEILPSKPPVETDKKIKKTRKVPTYTTHTRRGAHRPKRSSKTVPKDKTQSAEASKAVDRRDRSQASLDESTASEKSSNKSPDKSPNKKQNNRTSRKRPPSKRTPRKSPRKGVKKAVKLYIQGMKKNPKAAKKQTTKSTQKNIKVKRDQQEVEHEEEHPVMPKGVSKKLEVDFVDDANQTGSEGMTANDKDSNVIESSPKSTMKKRSMKLKDESECVVPVKAARQSPCKSPRTSPIDQTKELGDKPEDKYNFLEGFEPETPESVASQIAKKVSPKKTAMSVPAFITPPISPSTNKTSSSTTHSPATSTPIQQRKLNVMKKMTDKDGMEQMTMDLGQKRFGATSCEMCGMVYTAAHPEDEASHDKFHRKYLTSIKFPGWKKERLLQEFDDGRIIMVLHDDHKFQVKKVEEIRQLVDQELGFLQGGEVACKTSSKVLLYITTEKKVAGCLIAEEISQGYRVIADSSTGQRSSEEQELFEQQRAWCCETKPERAVCGVSRIWVASQERRKQIATKLLDCLRNYFMFGTVLPKELIAFSDPTPDGKMLATAYMKTPRFLVYKYH